MGRYRSYKKKKIMKGGYSDSASYMQSVVGGTNDQYNRVFQQGGINTSQSNAIMSVTGQRAGGRRKGKRGGSWVSDAIVPAAFIAGSYLYSRRKGSRSSFRKTRRRRR